MSPSPIGCEHGRRHQNDAINFIPFVRRGFLATWSQSVQQLFAEQAKPEALDVRHREAVDERRVDRVINLLRRRIFWATYFRAMSRRARDGGLFQMGVGIALRWRLPDAPDDVLRAGNGFSRVATSR
jgi:hypothetical protein